ncbi:MAG: hypothetical protein K2L72_05140, partial [Clostridia bacterium]|nr:hypothetical protein [Clostridia bacterium]
MEFKGVETEKSATKLTRIVSVAIGIILFVFEIIICVQYAANNPRPALWKIIGLVGCSVILDALCFVEMYFVKTFKARIVIYCIDFVFLLLICTLTGSTYLAGLYCVILSQFYLNVVDFKSKIIVFVSSCVMFVVTCVVGWLITHSEI